ncbi:ImmA/IrrE family metallo-endopeptidase [Acinetobacter baumannii]|uniref:ImmA/IrrE family metallo-endopeptidase n=1 Tax=Acinetobacter baumannii TaxID=470 RepID=UPI0021F30B55|nr:ImmA/IrrE family metallo-endopeptidase [Acinetobacter baumannii]
MDEKPHPPKIATRLLNILDVFCKAECREKFPIDVDMLSYEAANIFQWDDPISDILEISVGKFEGALLKKENSNQWVMLYNPSIESAGRILFTKAHELGHYVLHKSLQDGFECGNEDLQSYNSDSIEAEANRFSSYLLMPIDDFRQQINMADLMRSLSFCAQRYGVSLTAAILKWLEFTEESAVLINSRDGFMNWASASKTAAKNGAYFRTKSIITPIPESSIAGNSFIVEEKVGEKLRANIWFEHAHKEAYLTEYKISSEKYDHVLTLLLLPRSLEVRPPKYLD